MIFTLLLFVLVLILARYFYRGVYGVTKVLDEEEERRKENEKKDKKQNSEDGF